MFRRFQRFLRLLFRSRRRNSTLPLQCKLRLLLCKFHLQPYCHRRDHQAHRFQRSLKRLNQSVRNSMICNKLLPFHRLRRKQDICLQPLLCRKRAKAYRHKQRLQCHVRHNHRNSSRLLLPCKLHQLPCKLRLPLAY